MTDGFDVVAVGADDERGVVVGVILRAQTRRAIVLAASRKCREMEGVDLLATLRRERQVKMSWSFLGYSADTQR